MMIRINTQRELKKTLKLQNGSKPFFFQEYYVIGLPLSPIIHEKGEAILFKVDLKVRTHVTSPQFNNCPSRSQACHHGIPTRKVLAMQTTSTLSKKRSLTPQRTCAPL